MKSEDFNIHVTGETQKPFRSGRVPNFNLGDIITFTMIAQKPTNLDYTFNLTKSKGIHLENKHQ